MLRFLDGIAKDLDVGTGFDSSRVGVVVYGNTATVKISLADIENTPDLRVAVASIGYSPNERSNASAGILLMMQQFQQQNHANFAAKIAVLVTDGNLNSDSKDTVASAMEAKNKGITVFAIGVTNNIDQEELQQISSAPQLLGVNFFISPKFEALEYILPSVGAQIKRGKWYEYDSEYTKNLLISGRWSRKPSALQYTDDHLGLIESGSLTGSEPLQTTLRGIVARYWGPPNMAPKASPQSCIFLIENMALSFSY